MKEECLICKAPLEYLESDVLKECEICHKRENSKARCVNGHYVCSECHIMALEADGAPICTWRSSAPYDSLRSALEATTKEKLNARQAIATHRSLLAKLKAAKADPNVYVPVWYVKAGREYFLSPSSVGRVHQRDWEQIMGEYVPCTDLASLCPACRLFGTVEDGGLKGRVRFTDALLAGAPREGQFVTLDILSSPKPTAYEFYLNQPENAIFWNYDYYSVKNGETTEYKPLAGRLMPRGRKFYWHNPNAQIRNCAKSDQNATMEYLEPDGSVFRFRVYFDGLTDTELDQLTWVLNFGENKENGKYCHHIGHAKPLGFGSVKLTVDSVTRRELSWKNGSLTASVNEAPAADSIDCPWQAGNAGETPRRIAALMRMANINAVGAHPVMYPLGMNRDGAVAVYQWFSDNRRSSGVRCVLPEADEGNISIEAYAEASVVEHCKQSAAQSSTETTYRATVKSVRGIVVYLTVEGLDAPGYFRNDKHYSLREGKEVLVKKLQPNKNSYGNYVVDIVRFL